MLACVNQRVAIITRNKGRSYRNLTERFDVNKATMIALRQKHSQTGSVDDLAGRGRIRHSTQRDERQLSARNPLMVSRGLAQKIRQMGS